MIKLSIIGGFLTWGSTWLLGVFDTLDYFFSSGTDAIINQSTAIAAGISSAFPIPTIRLPSWMRRWRRFYRPKMAVTLLAMKVITGPYGLDFCHIAGAVTGVFPEGDADGYGSTRWRLFCWSLMISLTPIFLIFLLFERTRHLFIGWLEPAGEYLPAADFTVRTSPPRRCPFRRRIPVGAGMQDLHPGTVARRKPNMPYPWRFMLTCGAGCRSLGYGDSTASRALAEIYLYRHPAHPCVHSLGLNWLRFNAVVLMIARDLAGAAPTFPTCRPCRPIRFSPTTQ